MLPTRVKALGCSLAGTNQTCCMTRAHSCLHGNTFSRQHIQQACQRCVWMCYASITCAYAYASATAKSSQFRMYVPQGLSRSQGEAAPLTVRHGPR